MKLRLHLDAPEEGDPLSPLEASAVEAWEKILEKELLLLFPEAVKYSEVEVSVSVMDVLTMREVNGEYRDMDEATDVLAFPLWEEDGRFVPDGAPQELLPLGDILICPEEAARKHELLSSEEAFCLLLAHGFLHLLSWDHDTPEREQEMWERQAPIKDALLEVWQNVAKSGEGR